MRRLRRLICCTALALMALAGPRCRGDEPDSRRSHHHRDRPAVRHVARSGVKAYLGVPFAAPPVRELRWHEPMPAKSWKGIYNADSKITNCYIALRATTLNHYFGEIKSSEDCLNTNIWTPPGAKAGDHLPVVVWIHGGGFQEGSHQLRRL